MKGLIWSKVKKSVNEICIQLALSLTVTHLMDSYSDATHALLNDLYVIRLIAIQ